MNKFNDTSGKFIVRLYDGGDHYWIDVSGPVSWPEAVAIWEVKTANGTRNTEFKHFDYYDIFPADTQMLYNGIWLDSEDDEDE